MTSFASWDLTWVWPSDSTTTFSLALQQVDLVLCALETAATCSRFFVKGVLKIPFSSSQSKGSRCKRLVSFLAKSALGNFIILFDSTEIRSCALLESLLLGFSDLTLIFLLSSWCCWWFFWRQKNPSKYTRRKVSSVWVRRCWWGDHKSY